MSLEDEALKHVEMIEEILAVSSEDVGPCALIIFESLPKVTSKVIAAESAGAVEVFKGTEAAAATVPIDVEAHPSVDEVTVEVESTGAELPQLADV